MAARTPATAFPSPPDWSRNGGIAHRTPLRQVRPALVSRGQDVVVPRAGAKAKMPAVASRSARPVRNAQMPGRSPPRFRAARCETHRCPQIAHVSGARCETSLEASGAGRTSRYRSAGERLWRTADRAHARRWCWPLGLRPAAADRRALCALQASVQLLAQFRSTDQRVTGPLHTGVLPVGPYDVSCCPCAHIPRAGIRDWGRREPCRRTLTALLFRSRTATGTYGRGWRAPLANSPGGFVRERWRPWPGPPWSWKSRGAGPTQLGWKLCGQTGSSALLLGEGTSAGQLEFERVSTCPIWCCAGGARPAHADPDRVVTGLVRGPPMAGCGHELCLRDYFRTLPG